MLDPIPSLPRSNQALEWNQLFESRDQHLVAGLGLIGSAKGGFGLWPKLERERESARWWRTVEMGGRPVVAPSQLGGRRLPWFGSAKERREERRARERERDMLE